MILPPILRRWFSLGSIFLTLAAAGRTWAESVEITPPEWDFGDVVVGEFAGVTIRGTSTHATSPLIVTDIYLLLPPSENGFSVESVVPSAGPGPDLPYVLDPGEYVEAVVRFAPLSLGPQSIDLIFESNDHIDPDIEIPLTGQGIVPEPASALAMLLGLVGLVCLGRRRRVFRPGVVLCAVLSVCLILPAMARAEAVSITPPGWDFGEVMIDESASKTFHLQSTESTPLQVFSVSITDDPQGAFTVAGTDPDPIPLFLFENEFFEAFVTFAPPATGNFDGVFLLHSNDHLREYIEIPLTGRGIVPEPVSVITMLLGLAGMAYVCRRRRAVHR